MQKQSPEAGESLVEVLISLVVMGIIVSAFFTVIMTTTKSTTTQRDVVKADAVLRDYAETAKHVVRENCNSGNTATSFTVALPPAQLPNGFSVGPASVSCPSPTTVNMVEITATLPNGVEKQLSINVRTP